MIHGQQNVKYSILFYFSLHWVPLSTPVSMPTKAVVHLCRPTALVNAGLLLPLFSQITQRVPLS